METDKARRKMTKNEGWEERFRKRFTSTGLDIDGDLTGYVSEAIKFIRQELAQARQEVWEKTLMECNKRAEGICKNEGENLIKHFESCKDFSMTIPEIVADIKAIAFKKKEKK